MLTRIVTYGLLFAVLGVLALASTDPGVIGGSRGLSGPSGELRPTSPSAVYIIPIVLLVWVVLARRRRRSNDDEYPTSPGSK